MSYNIGIVGAARRHQGTGPFIAGTFNKLGHNINGIVGTSQTSIEQTVFLLGQQYEITTQGYLKLEELLDKQKIDILVIASPFDTHLDYLKDALFNGLHVFCEKPLWWPSNVDALPAFNEYQAEIQYCLDLAKDHQRIIHLNTQWPYTLRDFYRLHPNLISNKITHFTMHLSPQSQGIMMLIDAASHGLSMLYQLVGSGEIENISITENNSESMSVYFDFMHDSGITQTTFCFAKSAEMPKPASYEINHCKIDRTVSLPEYQIKLQSDKSSVAIQDPLETSIKDFLAEIDAGIQTDDTMLLHGTRHLYQLIKGYQ